MFSENLVKLRKREKLNQSEVARYLSISQQTYSRYENNINQPDIETILKLADFFNVTTDYLLKNGSEETIVTDEENLEAKEIVQKIGSLQKSFSKYECINLIQKLLDELKGKL